MNNLNVKTDTKKHCLSELMPYNATRGNGLRGCLNEYSLLLKVVERAIPAFNRREYEKFGVFIGSNARQMIAAKIAAIAQNPSNVTAEFIQTQVDNARKEVEKMLPESNKSFKARGATLQELLGPVDVALTSDEMFLVESFLLTDAQTTAQSLRFAKRSIPSLQIDFNSVIDNRGGWWRTSQSFRSKLMRKVRQLLSEASVAFVREQARCLGDQHLVTMCSPDFTVNINGLLCTPKFWTYKTLLLSAEKQGIPILIGTRFVAYHNSARMGKYSPMGEDCIFLRPRIESGYVKSVPCGGDLAKAAIFIQGAICDSDCSSDTLPLIKRLWRDVIADQKLDVILTVAAERQYPIPGAAERRIEELKDDELESYKKKALGQCYAFGNPGKFVVEHVYSAAVGSLPQLVQASEMLYKFWLLRTILPQEAMAQMPYYLENV